MKTIPLTQGKFAVVDDADYQSLSSLKWCARPVKLKNRIIWYAIYNVPRKRSGKREVVWMHRKILGIVDSNVQVDHADGNGLVNTRLNIRIATRNQNQQNKRKNGGCASAYKGVHLCNGKWRARITIDGKRRHLGYFASETEAASAYDSAAKHLFNKFALTNFS